MVTFFFLFNKVGMAYCLKDLLFFFLLELVVRKKRLGKLTLTSFQQLRGIEIYTIYKDRKTKALVL